MCYHHFSLLCVGDLSSSISYLIVITMRECSDSNERNCKCAIITSLCYMLCYGDLSSSISYLIVITMRVSVQIQMKETVRVLSSLLLVVCW